MRIQTVSTASGRGLAVTLLLAVLTVPSVTAVPVDNDVRSAAAIPELSKWLNEHPLSSETLKQFQMQDFANVGLSLADSQQASEIIWKSRFELLKKERAAEMESRSLTIGDKTMPFWFKVFGDKPEDGRSLFISMHGGGGAPAQVNDQQYENQKRLYQPAEGIYLVPRAPTNSWNLWHQQHIDEFFDRLITNMIVFEDVNPNRVYLMGYSAGGDGVFQLAPRMADRLAAAAMMAGHPNETQPDGLRNIGFTIHTGALDGAYNRNKIAGEWKTKLKELQEQDSDGYVHHVEVHAGRGHWMNLEDAVAVPWMAKFQRNSFPDRVVWKQDDVVHNRFYWLKMAKADASGRPRVVAEVTGNSVQIQESAVPNLTLLLHDQLLNLSEPLTVKHADTVLFTGSVKRSIAVIAESLLDRDDPNAIVYGTLDVSLPAAASGE